jgi:hypothetical protein
MKIWSNEHLAINSIATTIKIKNNANNNELPKTELTIIYTNPSINPAIRNPPP